jgi:hypothetical protein
MCLGKKMSKYIICPNNTGNLDEGKVSIIVPTNDFLNTYSVEDCAKKDVPIGYPYVIIGIEEIPMEYIEFFNAWEFDFSNPDGYGIGADAWFVEQEALNDNN